MQFIVPPGQLSKVKSKLSQVQLDYDSLIDDLEAAIEDSNKPQLQANRGSRGRQWQSNRNRNRKRNRNQNGYHNSDARGLETENYFSRHQNLEAIEAKVRELAESRRDYVQLEPLGSTYENRTVQLVKFSRDPTANRRVILIDAGHHAREVSRPASATRHARPAS